MKRYFLANYWLTYCFRGIHRRAYLVSMVSICFMPESVFFKHLHGIQLNQIKSMASCFIPMLWNTNQITGFHMFYPTVVAKHVHVIIKVLYDSPHPETILSHPTTSAPLCYIHLRWRFKYNLIQSYASNILTQNLLAAARQQQTRKP